MASDSDGNKGCGGPSGDMKAFREFFSKARNIVVLSGAGMSAESGVPTFRYVEKKKKRLCSEKIESFGSLFITEVWAHFLFSKIKYRRKKQQQK